MKGVGNDEDDDGNKTRIREDNNKININSIYQRDDEDDNGKKILPFQRHNYTPSN